MQEQGLKRLEFALESGDADFLRERLMNARAELGRHPEADDYSADLYGIMLALSSRIEAAERAQRLEKSWKDLYEDAFERYMEGDYLGALVQLGRYELSGISEGKASQVFVEGLRIAIADKIFSDELDGADDEKADELFTINAFSKKYIKVIIGEFPECKEQIYAGWCDAIDYAIDFRIGDTLEELPDGAEKLYLTSIDLFDKDELGQALLALMLAEEKDGGIRYRDDFEEYESELLHVIAGVFYYSAEVPLTKKNATALFYEMSQDYIVFENNAALRGINLPYIDAGGKISISQENLDRMKGKLESMIMGYLVKDDDCFC